MMGEPKPTQAAMAQKLSNDANYGRQRLLELWDGRFPSWDEFKNALGGHDVRTNTDIALFLIKHARSKKWNILYTGAYFLRSVSMYVLIATAIVIGLYFLRGLSAWWVVGSAFATLAAFKLSSKPFLASLATRAAASDEQLYEALVREGVFMFEPSRDSK